MPRHDRFDRSATGAPSRLGYSQPYRLSSPPKILKQFPVTFQVPPVGDESLAIAEVRTVFQQVNMILEHLVFDIPLNVTASLELDGQPIHNSSDNQGNVGGLPIIRGREVRQAKATFTNNSGAVRDAKYVLQGATL